VSVLSAYLRGVGLWTPAHPHFQAWLAAGAPDDLTAPEQGKRALPAAELLHPRLRRRTSVLTRASVTALEAAVAQGGAQLGAVRLILVSSFGEIETTVELLAQLAEPQGPVSPTKFHNSVHNTATGYMSIASGNAGEATALAGGPHNLEIGLLELFSGLAIDGGDAVLLLAEERIPAPFERPDADPTFAVALHFGAEPARAWHGASLDLRVGLAAVNAADAGPALPIGALASMVSPTVALLRAIAERIDPASQAGPLTVPLAPAAAAGVGCGFTLTLERP
jgi:hypothetical protein